MRSVYRFMVAAFCASLLSVAVQAEETTAKQVRLAAGDRAPAWTGQDIATDATIEFPQVLNGHPAVLVFWATWCPYCKAFMPYTGQIQTDYAAHGVQVITFNTNERDYGDPWAYVTELDFPLIAIADADAIAADYTVEYVPGLMVVDGEGDIVYRRGWTEQPPGQTIAEFWDGEVRAALDAVLGLEPDSPGG